MAPDSSSQVRSQQQQQRSQSCFSFASLVHPRTRLAVGISCLLGVVIIWVLSSELTRFIFVKEHFNKPFFTTYFKTTLFTLYLTGFLFLPGWRRLCSKTANIGQHRRQRRNASQRRRDGYTRVGDEASSDEEVDGNDREEVDEGVAVDGEENDDEPPLLSDPSYVPVHFDSSSDADSVASLSINSDVDSVRPDRADHCATGLMSQVEENDPIVRQDHQPVTITVSKLKSNLKVTTASPTNGDQSAGLLEAADHSATVSSQDDSSIDNKLNNNSNATNSNNARGVRFSRLSEVRQLSDSHAHAANMARLSYAAYLRAIENGRDLDLNQFHRRVAPLSVMEVAKLALLFCLVWFLGNWSYQEALNRSPAGVVNVVSTSSSLFTLLLSAAFPSEPRDRFSFSKLLAVLLCSAGVAMISWSDLAVFHQHSHVPWGTAFALIGSLCYAIYLVMLKRKAKSETALSFPMFFGFVGLFNALLLWPGFFVVHFTRVEPFLLPNNTDWGFITLNGIVGTTLSELLWLWGCFLSTSLLATLSLSLTIPLTLAADFVIDRVQYDWRFYCGSVPVFLSFVIVAFLSNSDNPDYDPALTFLTNCRQLLWATPSAGVNVRVSSRNRSVAKQRQHRRLTRSGNNNRVAPLSGPSVSVSTADVTIQEPSLTPASSRLENQSIVSVEQSVPSDNPAPVGSVQSA